MFNIGVGCVDLFPHQLWGRLLGRVWRQSRKTLGKSNPSAGYLPLREAISDYARSTRGLNCTPEQIIIVNGTQQAINLTAQVLLQQGDEVWLDEPGYDGALGAFLSQNMRVRPVSVDVESTNIADAIQQWPSVKLAFTAPSHQFPLGGMLSLSRRLALLDWAAEHHKWILEDDYNGEFRYSARPIQALQGLDKHQRVIYAGTFSKMLLPELRLGFLVVPPKLINAFQLAKHYADTHTAYLEQATLALLITEGHYARHVRRVRKACHERQTALIAAIEQYLPDKLSVQTSDSGIHLVCWLKGDLTEEEVINKCRQIRLGIQPLSRYCQRPYPKQAILLGYAAHTPEELREHIKKLALILDNKN
jgi:GntR family transcriptional regulator/MocR family aminotransferase